MDSLRAPTRHQVKHGSSSELMSEGDYGSDAAGAAPPSRFGAVVRPAGDARQAEWKAVESDVLTRGQQMFRSTTAMKKFDPAAKGAL